jgi:hypothetical protein
MNEYTLMCAIRKALEARLVELPLLVPARGGHPVSSRAASVYIGDLPPKGDGPDQVFPFVLLQARSGHFTSVEAVARVLIRCGVYNREPDDVTGEAAENDLGNLSAFIRRALFPFSQSPLESQYSLEADGKGEFLSWERPDQQPQPYAESWIVSIWRMPG